MRIATGRLASTLMPATSRLRRSASSSAGPNRGVIGADAGCGSACSAHCGTEAGRAARGAARPSGDEGGLQKLARSCGQFRNVRREALLLEPGAVEEVRLVLHARVAQHRDDGVPGAELAGERDGGGDVDAAGAAEQQSLF